MNRAHTGEQSSADPITVLYLDDDELLLDLQADIADERETVELVPTTDAERARASLADREFDHVIVGAGRTGPTAGELARDIAETYPDLTLTLYTWEPRSVAEAVDAFDAVIRKRATAAETVGLLDRVAGLDG